MDHIYSDAEQPKLKYVSVYDDISCGCKIVELKDVSINDGSSSGLHQLDKSLEARRHVIPDVISADETLMTDGHLVDIAGLVSMTWH